MHKDIYTIGHKLAKRDKLGIHAEIEKTTLELLSLVIEAAFTRKDSKSNILEKARVRGEVLKNIVRTEYELDAIDERTYLRLAEALVGISKDVSNWINYMGVTQKKPT